MALIEIRDEDLEWLKDILTGNITNDRRLYHYGESLNKQGMGAADKWQAILSRRIALCEEIVSKIDALKEGDSR